LLVPNVVPVVRLPPFQRLVDEHATGVHRYLVAAVGADEAADCFQETFLAALRGYPSVRSDQNLRGWLFTIARNKVMDCHRARVRRPLPVADVPERGAFDPRLEPTHPAWMAVRALPERQRHAVLLRYAGDLPFRDVAAVMGVNEIAARQHASTGVRALRQGGWDDGGE
jgi:RNA polymerase sigma factor (sigma-70 family)